MLIVFPPDHLREAFAPTEKADDRAGGPRHKLHSARFPGMTTAAAMTATSVSSTRMSSGKRRRAIRSLVSITMNEGPPGFVRPRPRRRGDKPPANRHSIKQEAPHPDGLGIQKVEEEIHGMIAIVVGFPGETPSRTAPPAVL